jgi:hypothetical protein
MNKLYIQSAKNVSCTIINQFQDGGQQSSKIIYYAEMHQQTVEKLTSLKGTYYTENPSIRFIVRYFSILLELGRYPMEVMVKRKIVLFWNNLLCESNKLSSILYMLMFKLHDQNPSYFKWILAIIALSYEFSFTRYFYIPNPLLYSE